MESVRLWLTLDSPNEGAGYELDASELKMQETNYNYRSMLFSVDIGSSPVCAEHASSLVLAGLGNPSNVGPMLYANCCLVGLKLIQFVNLLGLIREI